MAPLVIDDRGVCWDGGGREFRDAFYLRGVTGDLASLLVDKLGFVSVSLSHTGPIIRFHPKYLTDPAFAKLAYVLGKKSWQRLALVYAKPNQPAGYRIVASNRAAMETMQFLVEQARGPQMPFTSLPDTLEHLAQVEALGPVFDHWRTNDGVYAEADYRPLLSQRARDRYIIFAPCSRDGDLRIVQAGAGLHIPDKQSHAALPGTQLVDVADQAFGKWTASIYRGVLNCREPRFDHIYAAIHWPRAGRVERRYSRLILPCRAEDGQQLLLGISCDLGTPDLDLEAA